jgi:hypothetical protein
MVSHAHIAAVNPDTQQSYRSETTDSGTYFIPYIPPGTYTVTATADGFRTREQNNVVLEASTERGLNFVLEVGSTSQATTVSDTAPLLDTASGSGGTVLTGEEINTAPLNGRQVYMLLGTTPGSQFTVTTFGPGKNSGTRGWDVTNAYTLGGGVQGNQQFTLDGANITLQNNGKQGTWTIAPNADALQEANVMTSTFDSRYGRTGGGTVNMVIKSGSNAIHGTLYDYLENGALNANNIENNLNGQPRQNTHQQQFGGTIGAPIIKNKLFIFGSYEGYREVIPFTTLTNVPTANLRSLDGGANFAGSGYTIFDPNTTACAAPGGSIGNCAGNKYTRQAFVNNTIPVSRISPIGAALLNYFPAPNAGTGWTNNFIASTPDKYHYDQPMTRVDYDQNDKTRWNGLFAYQNGEEQRNDNGFPGVAETGAVQHWRDNLTASLDMTHIFTPTLLGDFKVSFTRFLDLENSGNFAAAVDPASIGLNMPHIPTTTLKDLPDITFSQIYTGEISNNVSNNVYNSFTADSEITKTWHNHTFHVGGEFGLFQYANPNSVGAADGAFQFGTTNSQYNPLLRNSLTGVLDGNPLADLLMGYPATSASSGVQWNHTGFESYPVFSVFTQDDWKVTPRLTLNIGLRYDVEFGATERYNQLNTGLCTTCANPLTNQINYPAVNAALAPYNASLGAVAGGLQFAGVNGQPRSPYHTDWSNVGPRIGFAYSADSKTVIRGGYGLFYSVGGQIGAANGFNVSTPYVGSNNGGVTPTNYFLSGTPFPNGAQAPTGSSAGLLTTLGSTLSLDSQDRRIPRSQIVSFGFQRELPDSFVLDVHYTGNFTSRLGVTTSLNGTLTLGELQQAQANPTFLNQQVPNPYYGLSGIPASSTLGSTKTISRELLLLPLSQFGGNISQTNNPLGTSDYNALETKLSRRIYGQNRGLNLQVAYTYSKTMQSTRYANTYPYQDTALQHEIGPYDRTNVLSVTGFWDLPVGKGSKYVAPDAKGVLGALINDWTFSWVFSAQSGFPLALQGGYNYGCSQSYAPAGGSTRAQWINNGNGNPASCWTPIPQYGLQELPQYISSVRQPTVPDLDISLQKNMRLTESLKLQLRGEAFNLTNTPLLGAPDTNPADKLQVSGGNLTGFGTVAPNQINFPRTIQFSLKFLF